MAPILGGFDKINYKSEREWAVASDDTKVPISIGRSCCLEFFLSLFRKISFNPTCCLGTEGTRLI